MSRESRQAREAAEQEEERVAYEARKAHFEQLGADLASKSSVELARMAAAETVELDGYWSPNYARANVLASLAVVAALREAAEAK